jgi:membrane dipeptidase
MRPYASLSESLVQLETIRASIAAMDDLALVARSVADIEDAVETNRVGVILGTQNSTMIEEDTALLASMKELGIRILQPNYNKPNRYACGAPQTGPADTGMTEAGTEWLEEMHRLRLVVDLSHCGHRSTSDFIAASRGRPLVVSHANAYAVCPSPRNKTDEHLRGVAETGGLTGAVMWTPAVRHDQRPSMEDYINHVDHMVKVAGIEHVAFASDTTESPATGPEVWDRTFGPNGTDQNITGILGDWFTYENRLNSDFQSLSHTPRVWEGLENRGYKEDAIEKIMRDNWLRVLSDIWGD